MPLKQNWTDRDTVTATFLNQLASAVNSAVASLAGKYTKPAGGIPASDLAGNVLDKTTADTIYATALAVPTEYTWDATTGSIAAITEHYPAPIGDRVTTYSGYNAAGDPTTETDPSGQHWTLAYDGNGNMISRTKVVA